MCHRIGQRLSLLFLLCLLPAMPLRALEWLALPDLGTGPETGLYGGAYLNLGWQGREGLQRELTTSLTASQNRQIQFDARYEWQLDSRRRADILVEAEEWPFIYYGIGNLADGEGDNLEQRRFELQGLMYQQLAGNLWLGYGGRYELFEVAGPVDGLWYRPEAPGASGGHYLSLLGELSHDSRDSADWATQGHHARLLLSATQGDDLSFLRWDSEWGLFRPLAGGVLAVRLHASGVGDDAPFTHLITPDSSKQLRGVSSSRFRDQLMIGSQLAWRWRWHSYFATNLFIDTVRVAPQWSELNAVDSQTAVGVGLRVAPKADSAKMIRVDLSRYREGVGVVASFGEAF